MRSKKAGASPPFFILKLILMKTHLKSHFIFFSALLLGALLVRPSWASDSALLQGEKQVITAADILADAQRIPLDSRALVLSQPETVSRIAGNLYVRRVMADQAQAAGIENDPLVSAALKIARDKVLSDAWLARIDKESVSSGADLKNLARNVYAAKPERFKVGEQVRVRHILIRDKDATGRALADKTLADLKAGANFEILAKERSADPGSKSKGGDLGLFERGRMAPEFERAAFAMTNPGELSGIVETEFGYHILKLEERRPAGVRPFEEVQEQIIKESLDTVRQNARAAAAQRIEEKATLNREALDVFTKSQKSQP
jgi:peptidyl-prolyl cis-trans isomerase C